ncbi:uncharacterized protein RCH25_004725 [Pelodytes ibericus]
MAFIPKFGRVKSSIAEEQESKSRERFSQEMSKVLLRNCSSQKPKYQLHKFLETVHLPVKRQDDVMKGRREMLPSEIPNRSSTSTRPTLGDQLCEGEYLALIQDLEQQLRSQMDKLEHLKLSVAEALCCSSSNTGFASIEQHCSDLKISLAEQAAFLSDLNERTESLQMSTSLFAQVSTKPKIWGSRRSFRRSNVRPQLCDDTQSELGWSLTRPRRNSNASELSCVW